MMRPIDADALIKDTWFVVIKGENIDDIAEQIIRQCKRIVSETPTIDAVSVVRCKECMFSKVYQNDSSGVMGRFCEAFTQVRMVSDDDFCSYGEREDE